MDPYIGKLLDNRYEILERIGTGGMAIVYKAKCHRLNRLVAVKILKSDLAQDADFRRRFNAESQAVAQLSHPNIVSVYDVSRGGELEYIIMELVDGITLKQYMERRGHLNWRESLHFITQIMRGLSHAHSRGIVHRDIKPQNVMVLRDGSVKVTDFGIACLENSAQTLTQEALGSVHYISPEQARGERTDARSDIYSAGVVLYEMLTNRLPFVGDSAVSVAIQHLSSIPLAPREIDPNIPEPLELICMKAMAPDLEQRYPSAEAMIADLEAFRKNPEVDLDFALQDLHPEGNDEPTRPLPHNVHPTSSLPRRNEEPIRRSNYDQDDGWEEEPVRRTNWVNTALICGIVILSLLIVLVLVRNIFSAFGQDNAQYKVPSVLGYTVDEVQAWDTIRDIFEIQIDGYAPSDNYPQDRIMEQDPKEGAVKKGENLVIHVTISSGEDTGEMINVVGKERRQANLELQDLISRYGLSVTEEETFSSEVNAGYVIETNPIEGQALRKGQSIVLTVSKGPEPKKATVILFVGNQIENVKKQLERLELKGNITEQESDKPAGEVTYQSIPANTEVDVGTVIDLTVSTGPKQEEEPPETPANPEGPSQTEPTTPDTPEPTEPDSPEEPVEGSDFLTIPLPSDGRETVDVQFINQKDGTLLLKENGVPCSQGSFGREFFGFGTMNVDVYFDGEYFNTYTLNFD